MIELIGYVVIALIIVMIINILTADEAEITLTLNGKKVIHYVKKDEKDGE